MRVMDLAIKDVLQLVRDWKAALFLLVMPIVFTLLFGLAFGGAGGAEDSRLPVGLVDREQSRLGASLLQLLETSAAIRPEVLTGRDAEPKRLEKRLQDGELAGVVIVPEGYEQRLLAGETAPLTLLADESQGAGTTARGEVQAAALRLAGSVEAARLGAEAFAERATLTDDEARAEFTWATIDRAVAAWQSPPVTVSAAQSGALAAEAEAQTMAQSGYSHTSPAMMVQFAIAGLIGAAEVLVLERRSRALRRLLTTAISRVEIVLGHYLAMFAMIAAQLIILIAFGQLLLGVGYMRAPLATGLLVLATALWTASLGLLIGVLAKTEDQVIIYSLVPMFILSGMGGAWMPLEFTGKTFQSIGHLLPTAWAMDGFKNVIVRGLGLESVLLPVGIMLAYGVVLFALAVWRFRFE